MAVGETLDIHSEIQALVSDKLQVVSYKWLSRNYSVSSNHAKRLLEEFVDKHGKELEVVYAVSGWLKNSSPQTYLIRLASGLNLAKIKQEFEDNCSAQVYSVQACIPKDVAVIWSSEFVQAEELFNQPLPTENCLRDNRFCGVSNFYVKRTIDGRSSGAFSQLKNVIGSGVKPQTSGILKVPSAQPPQQGPVMQSSSKHGMQSSILVTSGDKSDSTALVVNDQTGKSNIVKESITAVQTNKKRGQNEKPSSGSGASLASLWGRAKSKSSSPAIDTTTDVLNAAFSAEAQISAHEAADALSSDDDGLDLKCKRESNGASNRKRRFVMDFSDDEEQENAVSLTSPDASTGQPVPDPLHNTGKLTMDKKNLSFEDKKDDILEVKLENITVKNSALSLEGEIRGGNKNVIAGISLQPKAQRNNPKGPSDKNGGEVGNDKMTTSASTSPKRRKVLKTRIDEQGREVTEVVWEGEAVDGNSDKHIAKSDVVGRPPVTNKAQAAGIDATANPMSKAATANPVSKATTANPVSKAGNKKPTKGGGKDAKQGNILSFFKKV